MTSTSSAGASSITLQFDLKLGLDIAEQQVQAAINAAGNLLPGDLPSPPIYAKFNPADAPVRDPGRYLEDRAAHQGPRPGGYAARAEDLPASRRRPGQPRRRPESLAERRVAGSHRHPPSAPRTAPARSATSPPPPCSPPADASERASRAGAPSARCSRPARRPRRGPRRRVAPPGRDQERARRSRTSTCSAPKVADALAALVRETGFPRDRLLVQSFWPLSLDRIEAKLPGVGTGVPHLVEPPGPARHRHPGARQRPLRRGRAAGEGDRPRPATRST